MNCFAIKYKDIVQEVLFQLEQDLDEIDKVKYCVKE